MNNKIRDSLMFVITFSLIFYCVPMPLQQNFIGGVLGSQLCFYPIVIGMAYTIYCHYKYKYVLHDARKVFFFCFFYFGVILISLLIGLHKFPYYHLLENGPVGQFEKLVNIIDFLRRNGIDFSKDAILAVWLFLRPIKRLFLEVFYTFGTSYMIYLWYKNDWNQGIKMLVKGVLFSSVVIISYSAIEVFYLLDYSIASEILVYLTPYIHIVNYNGTWHPPILWVGQMRSVFTEPSHFGIYLAYCIPFLWLAAFYKRLFFVLPFVMTFFLFLTKSRSSFMLHVGEILILLIITTYICNRKKFKNTIIIIACSTIAFIGSTLFISNVIDNSQKTINENTINENTLNENIINGVYGYIDSNAISLANPDRRSNRARYSVMEADIRLGLDNPILGVGYELRNAYLKDYFSKEALDNPEVQLWLDLQCKLGILKAGIPLLGEYTSRFSQTGFVGLIMFLVPPLLLLYGILSKIKKAAFQNQVAFITFSISFLAILATGIGDGINLLYSYWIMLGLGYAMIAERKKQFVRNE